MSILTDNKILSASPLSPEIKQQKLKAAANNIVNTARETFNNLINVQRKGIDLVWKNELFTPQEIINELGDRAAAVFNLHSELSKFIADIAVANNVQVSLKAHTHSFTLSGDRIIVGEEL